MSRPPDAASATTAASRILRKGAFATTCPAWSGGRRSDSDAPCPYADASPLVEILGQLDSPTQGLTPMTSSLFALVLLAAALPAVAPADSLDATGATQPDSVVPAYVAPQYRCTGGEFGRPRYCYKVPMVRRPSITIGTIRGAIAEAAMPRRGGAAPRGRGKLGAWTGPSPSPT